MLLSTNPQIQAPHEEVSDLLTDAAQRAKDNDPKTVQPRDLRVVPLCRSQRFQELLNVWIAPPTPMLTHDREQPLSLRRGYVLVARVITDETWGGNEPGPSKRCMDECEVRSRELVGQEAIDIACVREDDSSRFAFIESVRGERTRPVSFSRIFTLSPESLGKIE